MPRPERPGTRKIKNPCYDPETKTDCPRRCGGCQLTCPEWKAYTEERDEEYRHRTIEFYANAIIGENRADAHDRFVKKQQRMKRHYR